MSNRIKVRNASLLIVDLAVDEDAGEIMWLTQAENGAVAVTRNRVCRDRAGNDPLPATRLLKLAPHDIADAAEQRVLVRDGAGGTHTYIAAPENGHGGTTIQ